MASVGDSGLVGVDAILYNLRQLEGPVMEAATVQGLAAMGGVALTAARANVTRRDHTLADLAALDHPYALRHGTIRVHQSEPHVVHSHSGRLARSLEGKLVRRPGGRGGGAHWKYRVGFDKAPPHYARFVVQGTRIMLGRDVLVITVNDPEVRKRMLRAVVNVIGPTLRLQAALRFRM